MSMIFLVGMPYAGKTYWGSTIAQLFHWPFIDLDEYIEGALNKSVTDIFEEDGEVVFRKKEQQVLQQLIDAKHRNTIVACGGGTPAFFNNMQQMKNSGCVVYIHTGIDILIKRCNDDNTRPLLAEKEDLHHKMNALLDERAAFYEQADYIVDGQNISVHTFEKIIEKCIDRQ